MVKILNKILSGSERTKTVKKNIFGSFAIKGLSIATSLFLVPFTIKLLDQEKYGVWMTIYAVISWVNMMDIGLGNGFRNKFAEAIAKDDKVLAKAYVQTFYSSMAIIACSLLLIYSAIYQFINWNAILNVKPGFDENLGNIVWWVFALFCLQLLLKNISTILLAIQKTSFSNSLGFAANLSSLIAIFFLQKFHLANLLSISMAFMIMPIVVYLVITPYLFLTSLKAYAPAFSLIPQKKYLKNLVGLGIKFFFIQITTVILFSTDNIVITQLFGPKEVTPYSVVYRLFSSTLVFLTIIVTPFWSAFTEANAKRDNVWIAKSVTKLIQIWGLFSVGVIALWLISPLVIHKWVGQQMNVSYGLTFQFALFAIIMGWNSPFVFYISSVGKIKLELWIAFVQVIITIPITVFCARSLHLGTTGVIMGTNIVLLIPAVFIPIQYYKLINGEAKGLWDQ